VLKGKKYTHYTLRADRPKDWQAKEHARMAEALAAYQGPVTKCPPESARDRALSASNRVAKGPSRLPKQWECAVILVIGAGTAPVQLSNAFKNQSSKIGSR